MTDDEIILKVCKVMTVAARGLIAHADLNDNGIVKGYGKDGRKLFEVRVKDLVGAIPSKQNWRIKSEGHMEFRDHTLIDP